MPRCLRRAAIFSPVVMVIASVKAIVQQSGGKEKGAKIAECKV